MKNNIKKILIPTDFSELGDFAYTMGTYIASKTNAKIEVISIVPGPQAALYSNDGDLLSDEGNDYSEWTQQLESNIETMKNWVSNKSNISDTSCSIGEVDKSIIEYATNHKIDLIIMGTDGLFNNSIWSRPSHAQFISNHSPIPVITLKCDRSDIQLNEIAFVGDFLHATKMNLDILKCLQIVFDSKILLLKIKTDDAKRSEMQIKEDMQAYANANHLENYEIHVYRDNSVESGIAKFAAEKDIDLITLGTYQGSGFSKLFRRSISDDVVNHLFHPVLTFPIE